MHRGHLWYVAISLTSIYIQITFILNASQNALNCSFDTSICMVYCNY